jgi:hypothetical protein
LITDLSFPPSPSEAKPIVILNLFQDNELMLPVILKQVQDDEIAAFESRWGGWSLFINRIPEQQALR